MNLLQKPGVSRLLVVLLLLAGTPSLSVAQQLTQTIRGRIIDKESQEPLPGATVAIYSLSPAVGTTTDLDGNFRLEQVPVGRHTLRISFMGYEEQVLPELLLGSGKEMILTIGLTESFKSLKEVVVSAKAQAKGAPLNEMATLSARSISVEETKRYAASINDPARAALNYAGVGASQDMGNEIVVRGNSPRGVLWRVEGVEVPNPSHFAEEGAAGGAVSILSVNMLDNSDFYTGAFPSEYGNALSGVFDIRLRHGNNEKREYAFQAGVLGVDFAAEGPFKQGSKASFLANYRYSTVAMLNAVGVKIAGDATPVFQDFSFKVRVPTAKAGIFSFWGLGGLSSQNMRAERDAAKWEDYYDRFDDVYTANMGATGVTHTLFLGKDDYLETTLSYSAKLTKVDFDSLSATYEAHPIYKHRIAYNTTRLSTLYNRKFNNRHTLRSGIILSQLGYDASSEGQNDDFEFVRFIKQDGSTSMVQAYTQWKYRLTEKLTLNSGLHATHFALNGNSSIEPRVGLKWQLMPGKSLSAGAGLHSRHEALSTYFTEQRVQDAVVQPNRNLGFTKAAHYVLAYDHLLREDLRLKVETYYQHLYNVPVGVGNSSLSTLNASAGFTTDSLVNEGTGRNYGLELTLEKFFTNNFYYLVTASLFDSKYTATDGIERSTRFNGNYITNFLAGKEFRVGKGGKNMIGTNIKLLWAGGNRYTPIDLEKSREKGNAVYKEEQENGAQADAYFRSDIRVSYRKNNPRASYILSLDLQNVTNRQNMFAQYYDRTTKDIKTSYQMGLVPVLNYRIEF
ncbi:TonB-dependent receptor plug domain-containing protein [Pontibacter qinzhouensis]|uniref:TonB-dependent receptor plug domain-containing protein n=1 Tax=Pontibacter qinzhouensis TaxID=2603253 RepID=A0A5C8JKH6_9BACT|nr:TonB-dependent receptor [Pontibacter qinzhouensis]TXK38138.1 TonB-dependent receptor plug domain-containing protein [Pontibacter qinzhouensis]